MATQINLSNPTEKSLSAAKKFMALPKGDPKFFSEIEKSLAGTKTANWTQVAKWMSTEYRHLGLQYRQEIRMEEIAGELVLVLGTGVIAKNGAFSDPSKCKLVDVPKMYVEDVFGDGDADGETDFIIHLNDGSRTWSNILYNLVRFENKEGSGKPIARKIPNLINSELKEFSKVLYRTGLEIKA